MTFRKIKNFDKNRPGLLPTLVFTCSIIFHILMINLVNIRNYFPRLDEFSFLDRRSAQAELV